ncbi:hypothetical protein D3C80_374480 [compost metagenome]
MEGLAEQFRNAPGVVDLHHPLGQRCVHGAEVDFLEGFAVALVASHLADEEDHRRRVLEGRVHTHRGVGGARPAGHEADAGLAGQLAVGLGHVGGAAFLPADDQVDGFAGVVQGIEDGEVAFTGNAEGALDTVDAQGIDQDLAAGAVRDGRLHGNSSGGLDGKAGAEAPADGLPEAQATFRCLSNGAARCQRSGGRSRVVEQSRMERRWVAA